MRMNAKPVFVDVVKSTERALNLLYLESKQRRSHVIDGVEFGNREFSFLMFGGGSNQPHRPEGAVDDLGSPFALASVDMNSMFLRAAGGIVNWRYGTPDRNATAVERWVKSQCLSGMYLPNLSRSALHCRLSVLGGCICVMDQTPIAWASISTLSDTYDSTVLIALHVLRFVYFWM